MQVAEQAQARARDKASETESGSLERVPLTSTISGHSGAASHSDIRSHVMDGARCRHPTRLRCSILYRRHAETWLACATLGVFNVPDSPRTLLPLGFAAGIFHRRV